MKPYARWKYALLLVTALLGTLYALPNVFGDEPSVQVATQNGDPLPADFGDQVAKVLATASLAPTAAANSGASGTRRSRPIRCLYLRRSLSCSIS